MSAAVGKYPTNRQALVHVCPRAKLHHATACNACYVGCRCRCDACRAAARSYCDRRRRQVAYGRWEPYVDAEDARAHVRWLSECGLGWQRVARLAGLYPSVVEKLVYGDPRRGMAPSRRVRPRTADRLLAVMPSQVAPGARVGSGAFRVHVRRLLERGWTKRAIAARIGVDESNLPRMLSGDQVLSRSSKAAARLDRAFPGRAPEWARRQPRGGLRYASDYQAVG